MKNSFTCRGRFAVRGLLAFGLLIHTQSFAKGLDKLAPATEESAADATNGAADAAPGENGKKTDAVSTSATNTAPTRAYQLATSYGWAALSKSSNSWHANGMSDLTVSYRLPMKIVGEAMYATFRYAPMSVAPMIKDAGQNYAYTGSVEGYHFGANAVFRIKERLTACGSAELGLMKVTLTDALGLPDHKVPNDSGVNMTVGGGADWEFLPGFDLGPRVYLGVGSFTAFQLGASGVFSF
jgi:hypothetical protein